MPLEPLIRSKRSKRLVGYGFFYVKESTECTECQVSDGFLWFLLTLPWKALFTHKERRASLATAGCGLFGVSTCFNISMF